MLKFLRNLIIFLIITIFVFFAIDGDLQSYLFGFQSFIQNKILFALLSIPLILFLYVPLIGLSAVYVPALKFANSDVKASVAKASGILFFLGPIGIFTYLFFVIATLDIPLYFRIIYIIVSAAPLATLMFIIVKELSRGAREKKSDKEINSVEDKVDKNNNEFNLESIRNRRLSDVPDVRSVARWEKGLLDKVMEKNLKEYNELTSKTLHSFFEAQEKNIKN